MADHRRRVQGFTDLGNIQIPPIAATWVLTDRADGVEYALIHDSTGGFIGLDNAASRVDVPSAVVFPAEQGPVLSADPTVRLLVRGGALGYEKLPLPTGVTDLDGSRVLSRRDNQSTILEIRQAAGWVDGDALIWEQVQA